MLKRKVIIATGSVVLAIAAYFTTTATRNFVGATSAYIRTCGGGHFTVFKGIAATASNLTTVKGTNHTAFFGCNFCGATCSTLFKIKTIGGGLIRTLFCKR